MEIFDLSEINSTEALVSNDENVKIVNKTLDPGEGIGLHIHEDSTDIGIVIAGSGHVKLGSLDDQDAETIPVSEGTILYIPPGEPHDLTNESEGPVQYVLLQAPPDPST